MKYYVILNDVQLGPLEPSEIKKLPVNPQTPVWCEGMADWAPMGSVAELADCLGTATPPGYATPGYDPYKASYAQPQYAPGMNQHEPVPECPPTYLAWAIVVTLLCCLPFGIVAIIYSSKVTSAWNRGDYAGAQTASDRAKTWTIVAAVGGLIWSIIYGILLFTGALGSLILENM